MQLKWATRGAFAAERNRQRMRFLGVTPKGHALWTEREDDIVRRFYPDYELLLRKLRRRSYYALRHRARVLGIVKRRHCWTGAEVSRLRRFYPTLDRAGLLQLFPGLSWSQIIGRAHGIKLRKARCRLTKTGFPIIDEIRERAFQLNLSMVDVDAMANTRHYFQRAGWCNRRTVNERHVVRAINALDGRIAIAWN